MRYLPHTAEDIESMLKTVGAASLDDLFASLPKAARLNRPLNLPPALSEMELRNHLRDLSRKNAHGEEWSSFLGAGAYAHYIPSAVAALLSRGEFMTAYTPYQPEISQGTLQAIFEYQTMVAEIMGLDLANASNYDGSTALAEAVLMALRINGRNKILIARSLHPEYREVLHTYLPHQEIRAICPKIVEIPFTPEGTLDRDFLKREVDADTSCVVVGTPNFFGVVEDVSDIADQVHSQGGLLITATTEILALGLFRSPGEMGADIAVAEGQSAGIPTSFGGPFLGFFATRREYIRNLPGRLVGETVDQNGQRGFVLTLATREQHIRREKATSNICTNVALCALASAITLALWGPRGFRDLALHNYNAAIDLKDQLSRIRGIQPCFSGVHFNEFVLKTRNPERLIQSLQSEKILAGLPLARWYPELKDGWLLCVTEMNQKAQVEELVAAVKRLGGEA